MTAQRRRRRQQGSSRSSSRCSSSPAALLLLVLLRCDLTVSDAQESNDEGGIPEGRCLPITKATEPKYFYYGDKPISVGIFTTDRLTHRLASTVLQILAQEVIGYHNVSLVALDDPRVGFDPVTQFGYISSCTDSRCQNLDLERELSPVPRAMVNLETWLPTNFQVNDWKVKDVGRLGPGGRFGWFLPERFARATPPIKDHWRALTTEEVAGLFALDADDDRAFIEAAMRAEDGSFVCEEDYCDGRGMFTASKCQGKPEGKCALLLTDFPVTSSLFSTSIVVGQIERLGLLVNVVFLGDRLTETVRRLESSSETVGSGAGSYLVFHYTPSPLAIDFNLTTVKFEPCDQRWGEMTPHMNDGYAGGRPMDRDQMTAASTAPTCLYNFNRFAKIIWPALEERAPSLYATVKKMKFSHGEYFDMLRLYEAYSAKAKAKDVVREAACAWLKQEFNAVGNGKPLYNYQRWYMLGEEKQKLTIGGIFPITGDKFNAPELLPVVSLAMQHVNANASILNNYDLDIMTFNGRCMASVVMHKFINIITSRDYKSTVGILGPACTDTVEPIAGVSTHFRTVVVTYSAEGSITEDPGSESEYPYFFRTIAENKQYKYVYLEIFKKFEWSKVASLALDGHKYSEYISHLQDVLQNEGINFITNRKFPVESPDMSMYLKDLKRRGARIIIGEFFERAARVTMCEAYKQGMTQRQGYVWFLPGWYHANWYDVDNLRNTTDPNDFMPNCTTAEMIEALDGHLSLIHSTFANDEDIMETGDSVQEWKDSLRAQINASFPGKPINKYSGYVYDGVWLYALALDRLIKQNKSYIQDIHSERSVGEFVKIIAESDFHGVSGRINFANGHSRLSNIKIIQWYNNTTHEIAVYEPDYGGVNGEQRGRLTQWLEANIRWQTPDGSKPNDHAKDCSILSDFATALDIECEHAIIFAFVIGFAVLLCSVLTVCFAFKRRYEMKMRQTEDRMRALGLMPPTSFLTLDEWEIPRDRVVINRKLGEGAFGTVFGGEAFFDEKGWVAVAVKTLKTGSTVEEKIDFLSEADMMKRFDHRNVVKLLGVCTRNEPVYTVMEFMLYGDLKTYLLARRHLVNEHDREDLDEVSNRRLTSMALDVARGLSYLAELKYVHRDVACRNCLVNSSRTVKLADFGMTRPMYEHDYYRFNKKGMLPVRWMAPESLADGLFTPMSDNWSYGVLLYEMITFGSFPFQGLSNNQVLEHVKAGNTLSIPAGIKNQLETLLKSCWNKTPTQRPTAAELVELLSNNPRLITPCVDVPLASVQVERTDSLELIPTAMANSRKPSTPGNTGTTTLTTTSLLSASQASFRCNKRTPEYSSSGPYSPMNGIPNGGVASPGMLHYKMGVREPLLGGGGIGTRDTSDGSASGGLCNGDSTSSSSGMKQNCNPTNNAGYVPPGYIVLDHRSTTAAAKTSLDDVELNNSISSV